MFASVEDFNADVGATDDDVCCCVCYGSLYAVVFMMLIWQDLIVKTTL